MPSSTTIADLTFTIARDGDLVSGAVEFPACFHRPPVQIYYRSMRPGDDPAPARTTARTDRRVCAVERFLELRRQHPDALKGFHYAQVAAEFNAGLRTVQYWLQQYERSGSSALGDHYTPAPPKALTCTQEHAKSAAVICAWWCLRINNASTIDTPMMHSAAGLVARGLPLPDVLAAIDCYYAWPCDRSRYPFKPFSRWARHDLETWLFRAADDADYHRAVAESQSDPVPLRGVDPDSLAALRRPRAPSIRTRKRDVHNRATRATLRALDSSSKRSAQPYGSISRDSPARLGSMGPAGDAAKGTLSSPANPPAIVADALALLPDQYRSMLFNAARGDRQARDTAIATIQVWWFPIFDPDAADGREPYGSDPDDLLDARWHRPKVTGFLRNLRDQLRGGLSTLAIAQRLPA